jgi:hypothetical protein
MNEALREALLTAGWRPGRSEVARVEAWRQRLDTPEGFTMFPAARDALAEFGGLKVDMTGPGIDFARGSFDLDPTLALCEEELFRDYEKEPKSRLYPLGEAYGGPMYLAISESGSVFAIDLIANEMRRIGRSMVEAMEGIVLGRRMCD